MISPPNHFTILALTPRKLALCIALVSSIGFATSIQGQNYFGAGFHLTTPIHLDYTKYPYVVVQPQAGLAWSCTYKKEWPVQKRNKWYAEAGLTTQGLRYYQVDYFPDTIANWSDFENRHTGYPCVLLGGGHTFEIGKSNNEFSLGLELSYLITQTLEGIGSVAFGIYHDPIKDATFPVFLRLNMGYTREIHFTKTWAGQLQLYTNLSAQNITQGSQFIYNKPDGRYAEGRYYVNNSELGLKLFTSLDGKSPKVISAKDSRNALLAQKEEAVKFRFSMAVQWYASPMAVFFVPQVDSFSVTSRNLRLPQAGLVVEIPFHKNKLWNTVLGLGIGPRVTSFVFESDGRYPRDKVPTKIGIDITEGTYLISTLGLSKRHALTKKLNGSNTLSASFSVPLNKEYQYFIIPLQSKGSQLPVENPNVEGWIDYRNGRDPFVYGFEYNPEIIFGLSQNAYMALGLVFNYSRGLAATGSFTVSNGQTDYYGVFHQKFSKIGISMRIGLEK